MKLKFDDIFAVTAPGLEEACAVELRTILGVDALAVSGGVQFSGGLRELYLANLHSRIASRVLVRIGEVRARDFSTFYNRCLKLPWGRFLKADTPVIVRASSRGSRLVHTGRLAETVGKSINHALGRDPSGVSEVAGLLIVARMDGDRCQFSIDSSGELLHRRGYRLETARAPLRETLAAGTLALLGWTGESSLVDPMCGAGTFLTEAAMIAAHRPVGAEREFAFMHWPRYRPGLWTQLLDEGGRGCTVPTSMIQGSDIDPDVVVAAAKNLQRAGCAEYVELLCRPITEVVGGVGPGLVVCNPPYGLRVGSGEDLLPLYRQIGEVYKEQFSGWKGALLCPPGRLAEATGLDLRQVATLVNGGLKVSLFSVDL